MERWWFCTWWSWGYLKIQKCIEGSYLINWKIIINGKIQFSKHVISNSVYGSLIYFTNHFNISRTNGKIFQRCCTSNRSCRKNETCNVRECIVLIPMPHLEQAIESSSWRNLLRHTSWWDQRIPWVDQSSSTNKLRTHGRTRSNLPLQWLFKLRRKSKH